MIDFTLTPSQQSLRANARTFAQTILSTAPSLSSHLPTQSQRFQSTLPIYRTAVQSGLIKSQIPIPLGGKSTGPLDAALVVEEFHAVEPSTAITILGTGLGLTPLILAGSKEQHEQFLRPFLANEGEPVASFAHSEPGGTANWLEEGGEGLQTTAYKDGDEWVVNGEKLWTTNSGGWDNHGADLTCLVCRLISPPSPSPSPTPSPNNPAQNILILLLTREVIASNPPSAYKILSDPELGGHKSVNGPHTKYTNLRIPNTHLLAPPNGSAAQIVETTFGMSAALVGAMAVGIMRHAFDVALAYAKAESRGGSKKIIEHQAVCERLIDAKLTIDAARGMVWRAMKMLEREDVGWDVKLEASVQAKVWCTERVVEVVQGGMGVVGMQSYKEEMGFVKMLQDAACLPLFDGGNVGVRRRQLEKIMRSDGYEAWAGIN